MVGQQKAVARIGSNRMVDFAIPVGVRYLALAIVVALWPNCLNAPNADDQPREGVAERMSLFAIEENQRPLRGKSPEKLLAERLLSRALKYP